MTDKKRVVGFFGVYILFNLAASFAHPVTPTVIQNLQLPDYMFGLALAVMMTTMFLFSPFWGRINSVISSRVSLLITCLGYAVAQALFGLATDMAGILLARLLAGCFTGGIYIASLAYVSNTSPSEKRDSYLTIYATLQSAFCAFGYFVGGMLGEISVACAFIAQVVCLVLCGIGFYLFCVKDTDPNVERPQPARLLRECNPFAAFAAGRSFLSFTWAKLLGVCCFSFLGYNAFEQVFNYYIKDQFGMSPSYNGTIKFAVGMIALLANFTLCVYLLNRTDIRVTTIPVLAFGTLAIVGVIFAPNVILFMTMAVVFYVFNSVSVPLAQNLVAARAQTGDSNLIMGFYQAVRAVGGMLGALLAGVLYEVGPKAPFVFAGIGFGLSAICAAGYLIDCRKQAERF